MAQRWVAARPGGPEVFDFVSYDVPLPASGEVTVQVRAAGVNPADASHVAEGRRGPFPRGVGYEIAGVITAIGPETEIASGGGAVGDEVLAFRVLGGWASEMNVPARDVFAKPGALTFEQAANLLLAATTASEMLHVTAVRPARRSWCTAPRAPSVSACCNRRRCSGCAWSAPAAAPASTTYAGSAASRWSTAPGWRDGSARPHPRASPRRSTVSARRGRRRVAGSGAGRCPHRHDRGETRGAELGIRVIGGDLPDSAAYRDGVRAHLVRLAADGGSRSRWPAPTRSNERWTRGGSCAGGTPAARWLHARPRPAAAYTCGPQPHGPD